MNNGPVGNPLLSILAAVSLWMAPTAQGGFLISDASFFDSIPHTLIDFETRGDGTPVDLPEGAVDSFGGGEYLNQGFIVGLDEYFWGNDPAADVEAALSIGGSLEHQLFMSGGNNAIAFVNETHAFGFFFTRNNSVGFPAPNLQILDESESVLATIDLADFIAGSVGIIDYGFVGYASQTPIEVVLFSNVEFAGFDDLRHSAIPAPGAGTPLLLAMCSALPRRRRRVPPMAAERGATGAARTV